MTRTRILVIEDEDSLRLALVDALAAQGHEVLEAADGERGLALALSEGPDVILLDLMLPLRDGFSVLRALREDRLAAAVLILSARGEEWDRVQGFEYGADDYVVKPFSMRELLLRVRAALQRLGGTAPGVPAGLDPRGRVRFGTVEVDFAAYTLTNDGARHGLSRRELELLRYFLVHEGTALDRLRLLSDVWGPDESPTTRTIDTHVLKLRKKLERDPERPRHLVTVHGVGYRFQRRPEEAP
jgi:two-component system alkaline phosphatase synthesis response regulator PhoP